MSRALQSQFTGCLETDLRRSSGLDAVNYRGFYLLLGNDKHATRSKNIRPFPLLNELLKVLGIDMIRTAHGLETFVSFQPPMLKSNRVKIGIQYIPTCFDQFIDLAFNLSKKIVQAHNGSISVRSDAGGTTFTVWLPLKQPESSLRPQRDNLLGM